MARRLRPRGRRSRGALISFEWVSDTLTEAMEAIPQETEAAISQVVETTTDRAFRIVKNRTPVDSGEARRGWRQEMRGSTGFIVNNVDYINVLEFGPYPVTPASHTQRRGLRRGRAVLGGAPPPRGRGTARTTRAPGGQPSMRSNVSKQAPKGMVRITLQEIEPRFVVDIADAINNLPSWKRS